MTLHQINWRFFFYEYPDFRSNIVGFSDPTIIAIAEEIDDWGKVRTYDGGYLWVYLRGDMRFVNRPMGLYRNRDDDSYVTVVPAQAFLVLEDAGNWLQVSSGIGPVWINLDFLPSTAELDNYFRRFGNRVGIFYKNMETGFTYMYNPDRIFFGASVPKLNHALYVYTLAERGYISLDRIHTYTHQDFWGGTGVLRHRPFGGEYTTRELLGYSVRESDNVAFRMLVREYNNPNLSYRAFVNELNANAALIRDVIAQNTTPRDAGIWAYAVYNYINSDGRYAHLLKEDLMNASVGFIVSDYPVAQKYGWYRRHFHDSAIVFAESPYILIILSDKGYDGGLHITNEPTSTHVLFEEISFFIQDFHNRHFGSYIP